MANSDNHTRETLAVGLSAHRNFYVWFRQYTPWQLGSSVCRKALLQAVLSSGKMMGCQKGNHLSNVSARSAARANRNQMEEGREKPGWVIRVFLKTNHQQNESIVCMLLGYKERAKATASLK